MLQSSYVLSRKVLEGCATVESGESSRVSCGMGSSCYNQVM